jgi:protocatechuate 3,4-dioxygenase beta subunit
MKQIILIIASCFYLLSCNEARSTQMKETTVKQVGGPCEGCEAIYESPVPFNQLDHTDTLPDFNEPGQKLEISGVVYRKDGKTPAPDVVLYIYHTNGDGVYPRKGDEQGWAQRHGYIRGWVKTNASGEYRFYTLRPGAYPDRNNPEHIHITVKEQDKSEYYIDDFFFADDPILGKVGRGCGERRGGDGILRPVEKNGMLTATRKIYLGRHIPGY